MTITVKKIGGSVAVLIPKSVAQEMNLREGTPLNISTTSDSIVMHKRTRRTRRAMARIVAELNPSAYKRRRLELGEDGPVGKEIW